MDALDREIAELEQKLTQKRQERIEKRKTERLAKRRVEAKEIRATFPEIIRELDRFAQELLRGEHPAWHHHTRNSRSFLDGWKLKYKWIDTDPDEECAAFHLELVLSDPQKVVRGRILNQERKLTEIKYYYEGSGSVPNHKTAREELPKMIQEIKQRLKKRLQTQ